MPALLDMDIHTDTGAHRTTGLPSVPPCCCREHVLIREHAFSRGYGIVLGAIVLLAIAKEAIDAVRLGSKRVNSVDKVLAPDFKACPPRSHGSASGTEGRQPGSQTGRQAGRQYPPRTLSTAQQRLSGTAACRILSGGLSVPVYQNKACDDRSVGMPTAAKQAVSRAVMATQAGQNGVSQAGLLGVIVNGEQRGPPYGQHSHQDGPEQVPIAPIA